VSEAAQALYVYGVVDSGEVADLDLAAIGAEQASVRAVPHAGIAALVSETDATDLKAAQQLRVHWHVLQEIAKRTTVLPVRFGTVVASEASVREEFLAPEAERLTALLERLSGKVQLSVKGFYEEEPLLREVVTGSPAVARMKERVDGLPEAAGYYDRIRLGELVAAEIERRRERDTAAVLERLEPIAVAARAEAAGTTDTAVNAAFLVERSRIEDFSGAVAQLADELSDRMRMRYVGPLPPYSFAETDVATGSGTWA
jgi:Gas vesicle synthesis protein GvpL/GvpF